MLPSHLYHICLYATFPFSPPLAFIWVGANTALMFIQPICLILNTFSDMKPISLKQFCAEEGITSMYRDWVRCKSSDRCFITLLHCKDDKNPIFAMSSTRYTPKCIVGEKADVKSLYISQDEDTLAYFVSTRRDAESVDDLFDED